MDDAPLATKERSTGVLTAYEHDVLLWSREQAALLRAGDYSRLDIEHVADEIEDVGKSEQNELESRLAVLLSHMLKWRFQPERRGSSWVRTLREQRRMVSRRLQRTPSLKVDFNDEEFFSGAWGEAVVQALRETGLEDMPQSCPWTREQILDQQFFPN